jgi:hypothetical protein
LNGEVLAFLYNYNKKELMPLVNGSIRQGKRIINLEMKAEKYLEKQVLVFYRLHQSRHSFQILVFPPLKPARTAGFPFLSGLNRIGWLL